MLAFQDLCYSTESKDLMFAATQMYNYNFNTIKTMAIKKKKNVKE